MLETIKAVAAIDVPLRHQPRSADDEALRFARSCYDHLAGKLGVALADALVARGYVALSDDGGEVTPSGAAGLSRFGVAVDTSSKRIYCRGCLDWSERRHHIAGHIGAELLQRCLERGWLTRRRGTRILTLTPAGRRGLREVFGVEFDQSALRRAS